MNHKINRMLDYAYNHTLSSTHKYPMAAVLTKKNKVISVGFNKSKTHPKQKERLGIYGMMYGRHRIHAELDCLIKAPYDVSGATMFVVRRNRFGFGMAKPCEACENLLREYGIKKAIFSISNGCFGVMEI